MQPDDSAAARLEFRRVARQRAIDKLPDVLAEVAERERGRAAVAVEVVADEAERRQVRARRERIEATDGQVMRVLEIEVREPTQVRGGREQFEILVGEPVEL